MIGRTAETPDLPSGAEMPAGVQTLVKLNRQLTSLPCVHGTSHGLLGDSYDSIQAVTDGRSPGSAVFVHAPDGQQLASEEERTP